MDTQSHIPTMSIQSELDAGCEESLNLLRRTRPSVYGQPSECCGDPATCAAACGDLREVVHV